jgi:ketosteroid isomerase-like protein
VSQENVEVVMKFHRGAGENTDLVRLFREEDLLSTPDAQSFLSSLFHENFEAIVADSPGARTYIGLAGFRELWLDWLEPWDSYRGEQDEPIDLGDRVLLTHIVYGRFKGSAEEVSAPGGNVWIVRDGKIVRVEFHSTRIAALKAVGLEE